jgi:hypothetical protein
MAASSWANDGVVLKAPEIKTTTKDKSAGYRNLRAAISDLPLSISQFLSVAEFVLLGAECRRGDGMPLNGGSTTAPRGVL